MLRQVKKLLAFILALALVFTTFTSDYTSAKVFAEGDTIEEQGEPEEEQDDSEDESEDEEEDEESEDEEETEDEEESEEASDEEKPEEEIPEEEIPEEKEESEEDEEGRIEITYVVDGEGGSVSNAKDSFDPESEEEITIEGSTAEASEGFKFAGWTGGYLEEPLMDETFVPDYTLITENVEFTASFEAAEPEKELGPVQDSAVVNGIRISLHAEEGILPADAKLVVKTLEESDEVSISEEDVKEAVDAATEETVTATYSFDINIYSEEAGGYVQPEDGSVEITFDVESSEISSAIEDENTDVSVYYIAEDGGDIQGIDKIDDVKTDESVSIETDHFSVYTVVLKNGAVTNDNNLGFTIKFRDYEKHSTKLQTEDSADEKTYEIGEGIITPAEIAKELRAEQITYNGEKYVFAEAVDGGSNNRKIEYFYVEKPANSNKYFAYYKAVGSDQAYTIGGAGSDVYFYYIKSVKSSNRMTIAIRNDGNAPSEPWIYDGKYYTFIADGENGGFDTGDISKYISIKDVSQTEITTVSTSPYDSKSYKVYAIAGIESVNGYLTQKFIDYANQKAKSHGKLHDGEYIDWYVIKYQTNDNVWHIDGVVRKSSKLTLSYDKNIPEGSSYSGHWPTGRQYDVNQWTKKATATVEGKNAVEKDGKEFISRPGYTFLGWNTDKNATVATYQEGNTIEFTEDTTLYAIWQRNTVNVKLTYKYADGKTGDTVVNSLKSYYVENIIADPTRDGYDFAGWKSDIEGDTNIYGKKSGWKNSITMPEKDVVLTAQWTAKPVNYIVRWLEKTADGDVDIKTADTSRKANTGSIAKAKEEDKRITGYDYDGVNSTPSVVVTADGRAEIKLYFKAHTHSIKYELTNDSAKPAGYDLPEQVSGIKYGSTNNVEDVPVIEGYTFTGWTAPRGVTVNDNGEFSMPDADVTFTGKFTAQNHKYTVYWWEKDGKDTIALPNPNLQNFTSEERWELTGKTVYANSDADTKIAGYTLDTSSVTSTVVKGDDSARIDLYFTKNSYTVTFVYENAAPNGTTPMTAPAPKSFKFNAIVDPYAEDVAKVTAPDGYTFDGWKYKNSKTPVGTFSMPSDNVTLYGKFTAKSGIKYVVEYYFEKVNSTDATNLNNYDIDNNKTINGDGTTGTSVDGYKKTFEGFKEDPTIKYVSRKNNKDTDVATGDKILGDGSLVIKLYYPRKSYTVSYEYDKDYSAINANPTSEELAQYTRQYKFGEIVEVKENASALGYTFGGWKYSTVEELEEATDPDSSNVFAKLAKALMGEAEHTYFEMPAGDVKLIGAFDAKKDTIYTVAHYLETAETGKYELGSVEQIGGDIEKNPEEKQGATGSKVTDYVREIEDYKHNTKVKADEFFDGNKVAQEDATILADGSLLINVYYQHSDDKVEFYVLLPNKPIPADGGARPTSDYYPNGSAAAESSGWVGTARLAQGQKWPVYDTNPDRAENIVEKDIISRPTGAINSDEGLQKLYPEVKEEDIVWYVYKHEGNNVSHIDGYIKNQKVEVIYNKNDGTSDPATYTDEEAKTGNYTVLGKENPSVNELMTREGHTFEGWSLNPKATPGSTDVIDPGSSIQVMTTGTVLYAVWSVNEYTVKYEYDKAPTGVTLPELPDKGLEVAHAFDSEVTVADPVKAPEGYYFTGWKTPVGVTVTDGKFKMPAKNIIIKGSFAKKLKVRIALAAPGDNTERLYNGQVQTPNTQIKFVVEGGDDPELAAYIQDTLNNAGDDVLGAFNTIRDMFVITAYAYDESLDLTPVADDEIPEGYEITGYTVVGEGGIDANKDRPGTADVDKKLVGREKDYPIVFNGSDMTIKKDGFDLREVADITVVDADGNEVTDLSSGITIGYLTIIPREVTLTSGSASRVANGTALTSPAVAISGDGFVAAVKDGETGDEIEVDKLKAEGAIGTITNPGSVENKIDEIGKFKTGFFRKDTNYVIKEVIGTLTITSGGGGGDDTPDTPSTPTTIPDAPVATAPAPTGAVLGAQREVPVDGPAVLGARRAGTDDTTSRTARAFVVLVSAAVALSLLISGKKKREN